MTLEHFFQKEPQCAIAFSGGADSAYLLYAAKQWGQKIKAYFVKTPFQPRFELEDATHLADQLGVELAVLTYDVLEDEMVAKNPPNRCYFCKKRIFAQILAAAKADGFSTVLDGTNASDDSSDRPGMQALAEMQIRSPLRECGLSKEEIRRLSAQAGLFTWDKPAYACLATRISTDRRITHEELMRVEGAEAFLASLGFRDFRLRSAGDTAKLQLREEDLPRALELRGRILSRLQEDYSQVLLDLQPRGDATLSRRENTGDTPADVVELSCNVDDMTGESIGFALEQFLTAGALEAYTVPIGMKKSRPGVKICLICSKERAEEMAALMLRHTTTLGVRETICARYTMSRRIRRQETPLGVVRVKESEGFGVRRSKYEYEDLAAIARERGMSIQQVLEELSK